MVLSCGAAKLMEGIIICDFILSFEPNVYVYSPEQRFFIECASCPDPRHPNAELCVIRNAGTDQCAEALQGAEDVRMTKCDESSKFQQFTFVRAPARSN